MTKHNYSGIAPDWRIKELVKEFGMIDPFVDKSVRELEVPVFVEDSDPWQDVEFGMIDTMRVVSYGLSSFGYDIQLADEFEIFMGWHPSKAMLIDPKNFDMNASYRHQGEFVIIPPHAFVLGRSVEYFKIPRHVITISVNKSTYARCGIFCNITCFEPGWEGHVTIEISNMTPYPAKVYANEGIAQILFFEGLSPSVSYADRGGKYQGQTGINAAQV